MDKKKQSIVFAAAVLLLLVIIYFKTINWMLVSWLENEYYSHGLLVPFISLYLVWRQKERLHSIEKNPSEYGFYILVASLVLHGIGFFWTIRSLSGISLVTAIIGMVMFFYGKEVVKTVAFPLAFLFFMIPVPFVDVLAPPLQSVSAIYSTKLVNLLGIPAYNTGYEIHLQSSAFEVGLPCSGIRSIISLLTIAALFAFILEGSMAMKFIILVSALPLAMLGNMLRITSVLIVAQKYGSEASMSYFHDFSSLVLFSVSLVGLFTVGRCFGRLRFKKIL